MMPLVVAMNMGIITAEELEEGKYPVYHIGEQRHFPLSIPSPDVDDNRQGVLCRLPFRKYWRDMVLAVFQSELLTCRYDGFRYELVADIPHQEWAICLMLFTFRNDEAPQRREPGCFSFFCFPGRGCCCMPCSAESISPSAGLPCRNGSRRIREVQAQRDASRIEVCEPPSNLQAIIHFARQLGDFDVRRQHHRTDHRLRRLHRPPGGRTSMQPDTVSTCSLHF